jgi:STELLO glycosyltransferase-like protein
MPEALTAVITTVQEPTPSVRSLALRLEEIGATLLIVGDERGPVRYEQDSTELISLEDQYRLPFSLPPLLPTNHYARKNLGYLVAFSRKSLCIYETDDDNAPNDSWTMREIRTSVQRVAPRRWVNVYRMFTDQPIWPRGFPLESASEASTWAHDRDVSIEQVDAPIQQGLPDRSPDVDAVWRLVMERTLTFDPAPSVWLPPGSWCPFNSQSTWWWPPAFPLMYLPSHCTFRMTDIWRSFVAQRCLWELEAGLVFHAPEVIQDRNRHDLLKDFEHEIPGYLNNQRITQTLADLTLGSGSGAVGDNLIRCYEALVAGGFLPPDEIPLLQAWLTDIDTSLGP